MIDNLWKLFRSFKNDESLKFTFLRSVFASQISSWIDFGIGFLLFSFLHLIPLIASGIGTILGGVVNFYINYKFTFKQSGNYLIFTVIKYLVVWLGSIFFNSYGTQQLYNLLLDSLWLKMLDFKPDGYYATARLFVSLLVSVGWNFPLLKIFVYKTTRIDEKLRDSNLTKKFQ